MIIHEFHLYFAVQCLVDFTVHWIKVEKFVISNDNFDYTVIKQVTKEQCINYCLVFNANYFLDMFNA